MVSSSPSPQGDVDSNLIVAKVVTSNEGKGGQGQEAQLTQFEFYFFAIFWPTFHSKILSLHLGFNYENIAKKINLRFQ